MFLKVQHPNWSDTSCFIQLPDKNLVRPESDGYRITCLNARNFTRLLDYNINIKQIEPGAEFKVSGVFKEGKYKLEIHCALNEKFYHEMKSSQMIIIIITKNNDINIVKTTDSTYTIEDTKITYTINNFNNNLKFLIGMMFLTQEEQFIEVVKVSYRYMVNKLNY